jgi:DNA-directed RNA polymerase subunit RPC12/RpoP
MVDMKMFRCGMCGGTFEQLRTDEEAEEEARRLYGVDKASTDPDMGVVCHDCWLKLEPLTRAH